jgi:hypothetical protein
MQVEITRGHPIFSNKARHVNGLSASLTCATGVITFSPSLYRYCFSSTDTRVAGSGAVGNSCLDPVSGEADQGPNWKKTLPETGSS